MKISIAIPSYKRANDVKTKKYVKKAKYYVDEGEAEEYRKYNPDIEIEICPKGVQGNIARVRNYILRTELEKYKNDAVLMVDDDLLGIYYFEKGERILLKSEEIDVFLEKYTLMAKELGVYLWGINCVNDKQAYREYTPFSLISYIGAPFMVFLRGNECFFDERIPLKEDYDMTLQQLNRYRKVLRVNKYHYEVLQSKQPGGCALMRNVEEERRQFEILQKKWGSKIVRQDRQKRSHNTDKDRKIFDYNPVIIPPIRGI